ncbi:MAG TPA: M10 family metallopeptidase C-terminal domain-containing protein [Ramlibacter sp.]|jgi:serralysin
MAVIAGTSGNDSLSGAGAADTIEGFGGYDTLSGGAGSDFLSGGEADDFIVGGGVGQGGADTIDGGAGRYDVLSYDYRASTAAVTFKSTIASGTQRDSLDGSTDTITGIEELHLFGSKGADKLSGDALNDIISGGRGNDTLAGGGGNDAFWWNAEEPGGDDTLADLDAYDELTFEGLQIARLRSGNDPSELKAGELMLGTPSGGTTRLYVRLGDGTGTLSTITLAGSFGPADFSVDTYGTFSSELSVRAVGTGDDYLDGGTGRELIDGQTGDDWISGFNGNDTLTGGGGHDAFIYDAMYEANGRDTITDLGANDVVVFERVQVTGFRQDVPPQDLQAGQMQLQLTAGGATTLLHLQTGGEHGLLTIVLQGSFTPHDFTLTHNNYSSRLEVKTVAGQAERFHGSYRDDSVVGGQGDDTLEGFYGKDTLDGGAGADHLRGGSGADLLRGGGGNDTYYLGNAGDNISGESSASAGGLDTVITSVDYSASRDYVEYLVAAEGTAGVDLTGNQLANRLTGNDGRNILNGAAGADTLAGGKGHDTYRLDNPGDNISGESSASAGGVDTVITGVDYSASRDYVEYLVAAEGTAGVDLTGNQLANRLTGNAGRNSLEGAAGADRLTGGSGADRFVYDKASDSTMADRDRITDFTRGSDKLDLSGLDANATRSGHQDFSFIGSRAFGANATGQLRFAVESGTVMLYGSTDADAAAEFAVQVAGATTLAASDFLF